MSSLPIIAGSRLRHECIATFRLALPIILGQLSAMGMNVVDVLLAGHVDAHTLAAVAVGGSVWTLVIVAVIGVLMALPPSISQLVGAKQIQRIGPLFRQSLWLALLLGLVLFAAVRQAEWLLRFMAVDPRIIGDTLRFLKAISYGAPALALYFSLRGVSEGLGLTRPTMYFGSLGLVLLIPLGYVWTYGKFGFPVGGAQGLGAATAVVLWLQLLGLFLYLLYRKHYRAYSLFGRFDWPDWRSIGVLLRLGIPMGIALLMEAGLFVTVALLIGSLGEAPVASHQVALNFASVAFMLPLGLAMAITVRVGNAVGRNDAQAVRYAGFVGIGMTLITQTLSALGMTLFPAAIVGLYTDDAMVAALAIQLLGLAALFQFSDGIQVAANGALRGLKDTKLPMIITVVAYWGIGMPIGYFLAFYRGLGAPGMWIGLIAGLSAAAVLLFARFYRLARHWTPSIKKTAPIVTTDS